MNSWTYFLDISGRVSRNLKSKTVTVGGVAIPTISVDSVRKKLPTLIKYQNSSPKEVESVFSFLVENQIYCSMIRIHKSNPHWNKFWQTGKKYHSKSASKEHQRVGFVKPGILLRFYLFLKCAVSLGSIIIKSKNLRLFNASGNKIFNIDIVCDTDIPGKENQELYKQTYQDWANNTKLKEIFNIAANIDKVDFKTEQQEPLLLLPDYLAGFGQHFEEFQKEMQLIKILEGGLKELFDRKQINFDIEYPLSFNELGRPILVQNGN